MARSDGRWADRITAARRRGRFDAEDLADASGWDMDVSPVAEVTRAYGQTVRCWSQCVLYFGGRMVGPRERLRQAVRADDFDDAEAELIRMGVIARKG